MIGLRVWIDIDTQLPRGLPPSFCYVGGIERPGNKWSLGYTKNMSSSIRPFSSIQIHTYDASTAFTFNNLCNKSYWNGKYLIEVLKLAKIVYQENFA